ncbi:NADH dehydrogenase subunit 5 [Ectobacillus sp. sgz5001026]|uniref:NADH dehydrogenase subunit 5 n=1 Tax=Ectobacillus sp. sgz5001026 TaxID=3242473 RepID=UPI0036D33FAA
MVSALPVVFFFVLALSVLSAILLLYPKVPLQYVRVHVGILALPPLVALFALVMAKGSMVFGPWRFDSLSWLVALFVLTIGLIVQRYSVRYLFGDRYYRKYFALLTFTTVADSVAWLSDDVRLLLLCWGATLFGLTLLIRLKKEWGVARLAGLVTGRLFAVSWMALLLAVIWLTMATGHHQLSLILEKDSLAKVASWQRTGMNLLLLVAVMIPAAQWPFQRWLLDSVVTPTPISAVMHAGIVNAGGILLTRFSPLFNGDVAQVILLLIASISVLIGTGIMLVHVDYKRQLVGSTIAQMGFMLIQCALGAYLAAIIHAVLHGLFKSTLFLQAGSAAQRKDSIPQVTQSISVVWIVVGGALGLLMGIGFWLTAPVETYQLISAFILGWSVLVAWAQLLALASSFIERIVGLVLFTGTSFVFFLIHKAFYNLLHETISVSVQPPTLLAVILLLLLLVASGVGVWFKHNRSSKPFSILYLWLVRFGESKHDLVESHPRYLTQLLTRGGNVR